MFIGGWVCGFIVCIEGQVFVVVVYLVDVLGWYVDYQCEIWYIFLYDGVGVDEGMMVNFDVVDDCVVCV